MRKLVEKQLSDKSEFMKLKMIKAMEILESNPYVSIEEVAVAMKVSSSTAKRYITELKKEGLIERVGPDNGGFWKII
ncbi:MAG: winged helix-turn-helix transcriptional regulator [Erysipelotrichaceae bacterium]|nr:winged helix-turn-helix transcriptional regulator [Erysipelotrichaceae bacterium]